MSEREAFEILVYLYGIATGVYVARSFYLSKISKLNDSIDAEMVKYKKATGWLWAKHRALERELNKTKRARGRYDIHDKR